MCRLTQKSLIEGIKRGLTLGDFSEKLKCSEDEVVEEIRKLYKGNDKKTKNIIREIKANGKKLNAPKKAKAVKEASSSTPEEGVKVAADYKPSNHEQNAAKDNKSELNRLKELEEKQSKEITALEKKHAELALEHKEVQNRAVEICAEFNKLMVATREKYQEFIETKLSAAKITDGMKMISEQLREKKAVLKETRDKIDELELVTICVFESGKIEVDGTEMPVPGDEILFAKLVLKEECQNLRVKDIKTLAKVINFISSNDFKKYELLFDEPEMEKAFHALIPA